MNFREPYQPLGQRPAATGVFKRLARRVIRAGIGVMQAALLTSFGALDLSFYSLQTSATLRRKFAAAYHFSTLGRRQGLSVSPLVSFRYMRATGKPRVQAGMWGNPKLRGIGQLQTHPLIGQSDSPAKICGCRSGRRLVRELLELPTYTPLSGGDPEVFGQRIVLGDLTDAIETALGDGPSAALAGGVAEYDLTVIVDDVGSWERGLSTLKMLQNACGSLSFEVILVPTDSRPDRMALLAALTLATTTSVSLLASLSTSRAVRLNLAGGQARGDFVLYMHVGHVFSGGAIQTLIDIAADSSASAVQPVVIDQSGLIRSAGVLADPTSGFPMRFLRGVPLETADLVRTPIVTEAVTFPFVLRKAVAECPTFFNPELGSMWLDVDFSTRAAAEIGLPSLVVSTVTAKEIMRPPYADNACALDDLAAYRRSHFFSASLLSEAFSATTLEFSGIEGVVPERSPATPQRWRQLRLARPHIQIGTRDPRLRWSIKTAAPIPQGRTVWGDSHFADGLAEALRRLGQIVCIDTVENAKKPLPLLDDVVVTLRGLAKIDRIPGVTNVIWIISHPDLVTREEVVSYDLAYAASEGWARRKSEVWDTKVTSLLQCTDPRLFAPGFNVSPHRGVLFVGNTRGQLRPVVEAARTAGADLEVYGSGWTGLIDDNTWKGESLPRESLPHHYASATAVLNDHWPDMRREGFISNRLFDIVASGGWAVSDNVTGLEENLGGVVTSVATAEDLATLLLNPDRYRPQDQLLRAAAEQVRRSHTFDVRARQLLDDVICHLAAKDNGQPAGREREF